jgi:hypothetical protein
VVSEIASRYDGALAISRSKLGGACFDLVLKL